MTLAYSFISIRDFLKTQGNSTVPLKITFFFIMFPLLFFFFFREKKHMVQSQCIFIYIIFTFIFKQIILRELKRETVFIQYQLCARNSSSPYLCETLYSLRLHNYFACPINKETQRRTSICPRSNSQ